MSAVVSEDDHRDRDVPPSLAYIIARNGDPITLALRSGEELSQDDLLQLRKGPSSAASSIGSSPSAVFSWRKPSIATESVSYSTRHPAHDHDGEGAMQAADTSSLRASRGSDEGDATYPASLPATFGSGSDAEDENYEALPTLFGAGAWSLSREGESRLLRRNEHAKVRLSKMLPHRLKKRPAVILHGNPSSKQETETVNTTSADINQMVGQSSLWTQLKGLLFRGADRTEINEATMSANRVLQSWHEPESVLPPSPSAMGVGQPNVGGLVSSSSKQLEPSTNHVRSTDPTDSEPTGCSNGDPPQHRYRNKNEPTGHVSIIDPSKKLVESTEGSVHDVREPVDTLSGIDDLKPVNLLAEDEKLGALSQTVYPFPKVMGSSRGHTLDDSDGETDRQSVVSLGPSVFSSASHASSATGVSAVGNYNAVQIESATKELLQIFLEDEYLVSLYKVAVELDNIGTERLKRNVRRLLNVFARNLQTQADTELERLTSRLVFWKASFISRQIVEAFEVRRYEHVASDPQARRNCSFPDDSEDEDEEVEGGAPGEAVDEDLIEDLPAFRRFLVEGQPFETFQQQLRAFVEPKESDTMRNLFTEEVTSEQTLFIPKGEISLGQVGEELVTPCDHGGFLQKGRSMFRSLVVAVGLLEPPQTPGWFRLRWQCRCGDSFFGDVQEHRAGGVEELVAKMRRSTNASVTVNPYSKTSSNQKWCLKPPAWARNLAKASFSPGQQTGTSSTGSLPRHNSPNQSIPLPVLSLATSTQTSPGPTLHLLACVHRTQRSKRLLQDPVDKVRNDRALFRFMKQQLKHNSSRIRSILSMRSVQGMFFVKFRLRMDNFVEVRDHDPCCTLSMPNTCECIPPAPKVEPSPNAEYRCRPPGPVATWPPVLSQDLMHMLSSPECINEQETWVLDQLPKRTAGELQGQAGQRVEGWGVYYQEGVDFDLIIGWIFSIFLLASLLFGILWTVLEKDIQGAFGISSYIVTASGIFLAWMASRAKNFG